MSENGDTLCPVKVQKFTGFGGPENGIFNHQIPGFWHRFQRWGVHRSGGPGMPGVLGFWGWDFTNHRGVDTGGQTTKGHKSSAGWRPGSLEFSFENRVAPGS